MFRFIRCCKVNLRLCDTIFDNLTRRVSIYNEIVTPLTTNTNHVNFAKFSSSSAITSAAETEEPNIAEITEGNVDLEHKVRVLILEAEVWRQEGLAIPDESSIKTNNWKELLKLPTKSARRRYFDYLFKMEKKKENIVKKKEQKRLDWEQTPKLKRDLEDVNNHELGANSFFLRIYDSTINQMYNNRLVQAMQFGQKMVVDCGYHENMTVRENTNCAKQLMLLFAENRMHDEPFDLHYCNATPNSSLMKGLKKFIPIMYEPSFPLNLHEQSYLDVFPKEQLVYLTPHCKDVMYEFDHNAIYIIGAIVDKVNCEPLSLAKAKKEGLRMAKLPLDRYLAWGSGSGKSLTINQVVSILLDVKRTGDWKYAFRHVPRRKLMDYRQEPEVVNKFKSRTGEVQKPRSTWRPSASNNVNDNSFKKKSYR